MSNELKPEETVPGWLWGLVTWGFVLSVLGVVGLAAALRLGLADPPRAGPLLWQMDFKSGTPGWAFLAPPGGRLAQEQGALVASFVQAVEGQEAVGLTAGPAGSFTLEVAGAADDASQGLAYGLVFGWQDSAHYSAVLINANGYAEAFQRDGQARTDWFEWQQWPHILVGSTSNRIRIDVRGQALTLRINDELLASATASAPAGQIGVMARADGPGRVVFSWVRVWAGGKQK